MAVLGAAAALISGLGGIGGALLFLLLSLPLIVRGDPAVALSGLLTGFGALWSFGMARQLATGGRLDDAELWWAVGVMPLIIGCALLVLAAAQAFRRAAPQS
jgi:hypothetical protein